MAAKWTHQEYNAALAKPSCTYDFNRVRDVPAPERKDAIERMARQCGCVRCAFYTAHGIWASGI